jgi:hypothetical protein
MELVKYNRVDPVASTFEDIKEVCRELVKSGLLPRSIKTPEQAFAIVLAGREVGIPEWNSLNKIQIIEGKTAMAAELMMALFRQRVGGTAQIIESSDIVCTILFKRPNEEPHRETFTIDDAKRLGFVDKDNWKKQPRTMLRWRCVSAGLRFYAPDALSGISYTPEELGAIVDDEGNAVNLNDSASKPEIIEVTLEKMGPAQDVQEFVRLAHGCKSITDLVVLCAEYDALWAEPVFQREKYSRFVDFGARFLQPLKNEPTEYVPDWLTPEFYALEEAKTLEELDRVYHTGKPVMEQFKITNVWRSHANTIVTYLESRGSK